MNDFTIKHGKCAVKLHLLSVTCMYVYTCTCTLCQDERSGICPFDSILLWKCLKGLNSFFAPIYIGTTNIWKRKSQTKQSSFKLKYAIDFRFVLLCDEQKNVKTGVKMMQESFQNFIFFLRSIKVEIICTGVGKAPSSWEETFWAKNRKQLLKVLVLGT